MKLRGTVMALTCALVLGLLGLIFLPSSGVARCTDPPGGTDCK